MTLSTLNAKSTAPLSSLSLFNTREARNKKCNLKSLSSTRSTKKNCISVMLHSDELCLIMKQMVWSTHKLTNLRTLYHQMLALCLTKDDVIYAQSLMRSADFAQHRSLHRSYEYFSYHIFHSWNIISFFYFMYGDSSRISVYFRNSTSDVIIGFLVVNQHIQICDKQTMFQNALRFEVDFVPPHKIFDERFSRSTICPLFILK